MLLFFLLDGLAGRTVLPKSVGAGEFLGRGGKKYC